MSDAGTDSDVEFATAPPIVVEVPDAANDAPRILELPTPKVDPSFMRGFCFGNRLDAPNEGDWGPKIRVEDFASVRERGFDHVRLPVRFAAHAAETAPFEFKAEFLERVDSVIEQILDHELSLVLDLQYYDELMSEPDAQRERFLALWGQLAERYRNLPQHVAFELLSEPNGELGATYTQLVADTVELIRGTNPTRRVIVNSFEYARITTLAELELPDDENVVASVHVYTPKPFTFQGAAWAGAEYGTTGVVFPGPPEQPIEPVAAALANAETKSWFEDYNTLPTEENPSGPSAIEAAISALVEYRQTHGNEVYLGEFGTTRNGPEDSRFRFLEMLRTRAEEEAIGWAVWDNNGSDMAVLGEEPGTWRDSTIDALIAPE
jgi:endoglucanase